MDEQERSALGCYRSDLRNVVGSSASAYGYTLTVWSTASVLTHAYGLTSPLEVFSFFLGAVAGFAVVGTLPSGASRQSSAARADGCGCGGASASFRWPWRWGRRGSCLRTCRACQDGPWDRSLRRCVTSAW